MSITLTVEANVEDPEERFLRTVNTRIAGGGRLAATAQPPRVVVDVREFRSSLPSLLHGKSIVVVPCMLTVGDYVLTPKSASSANPSAISSAPLPTAVSTTK